MGSVFKSQSGIVSVFLFLSFLINSLVWPDCGTLFYTIVIVGDRVVVSQAMLTVGTFVAI